VSQEIPDRYDRAEAAAREMWREIRQIDQFSMSVRLRICLGSETGEFCRKWRARQDSNLRLPA